MPSLPLFTTAYLLSLLLFHGQATLPWIWSMAFDTFGEKSVILFAWSAVFLLLGIRGGVSRQATEKLGWFILGFAMAQLCTGIQAAAHQQAQVPLACGNCQGICRPV